MVMFAGAVLLLPLNNTPIELRKFKIIREEGKKKKKKDWIGKINSEGADRYLL